MMLAATDNAMLHNYGAGTDNAVLHMVLVLIMLQTEGVHKNGAIK